MLYSTRVFRCCQLCGEEVLQSAGGCLGLSALCWTSLTKRWKSVPWLTGWKNKGALCAYAIDGCPSTSSSAVNGNNRLRYKIKKCEYGLRIKGVPVCMTGDHITRYFKWQDLDVWLAKAPVAAIGSVWLKVSPHLSIFWNPTFTGVAGPFAHCRQGDSKCLYLFVL